MVLKDIKNDPDVSAGLHPPVGSSKRRMSDSGCRSSLPHKSKIRKGILQKGVDDCFVGTCSGHNLRNMCSDLTNSLGTGSVVLQSKDLRKSGKADSSNRGELENDDGMVPTVIAKNVSLLPSKIRFSSPERHSASKLLSTSSMSVSYFADPTDYNENEELESSEITVDNGNKYFSTPMASKKVKKKLTPVIELDIETSEDWRSKDKISSMDVIPKNSYSVDVLPQESPTQTPLYRSFFAVECQGIVNQIEGIEAVVKSPVKRKVEELDVSTIDAEPPPYDCTPMKSMLACEVASMMHSLENSPIKEGVSLFGESLLDLEKMDPHLHDFNVSDCIKDQSLSNSGIEGISYLSDRLNRSCSKKRPKIEQLDKNECEIKSTCQTEVMGPLASVTEHFIPLILQQFENKKACDIESVSGSANNKSGLINTTQNPKSHALVDTTQVMKIEHKFIDNLIEPAVLMHNDSIAMNIKVIESSPKHLANTTQTISAVHEDLTVGSSMQLNEGNLSKQCSNITQDILMICDGLLPPITTNQVIKVVEKTINLTLDITSMHKVTTENTTHVIESVPQTPNITQDISSMHEEINIANTTQVIDLVPQTSATITEEVLLIQEEVDPANTTQVIEVEQQNTASTTQDISSMHEEVAAANTTQVIEVEQQNTASTTQDISSMHEEVAAANTTQVIEVEQQNTASTTQDIPSIHEVAAINTTQVIEVGLQSSTNTTQDIVSKYEEVAATNSTQVIEVGPQSSANTTQDIVSIHEEIHTAPSILIMEVVPQLPARNIEVNALLHEVIITDPTQVTTASTIQVIEVGPQSSANTTQDIVSICEEIPNPPDIEIMEVVPQLTASNTEVIAFMDEVITVNTDDLKIASKASTNGTQSTTSIHDEVITTNNQEPVAVSNTSGSTKLEISAVDVIEAPKDALPKTAYNASQNVALLLDEVLITNTQLFEAVPQTPSSTILDTTGRHGTVLVDLAFLGATEHHSYKAKQMFAEVSEGSHIPSPKEVLVHSVRLSVSPSDYLVTENKEDTWVLNGHENVDIPSILHPQETLYLNEANVTQMSESAGDQILEVDMACGVTDHGTLVGTIAQTKTNVTEGELSNAVEEKCCKSDVVLASLQNEMDTCKESNVYPLPSESCSMIQEEENVHDVSVFSAGSLSFVTSTPVPGFNNFQFQKPCRDSLHQDPNVSLGSITEESAKKVPVQQGLTTQLKSLGVQELNTNQMKQISRHAMLPPCIERCIRPPSGLIHRQIPPTSGIPSARRSLALFNTTGQNPAKEPMFSKNTPRGIPGRGIIRPPLARQSLPRVGPGNLKQNTEGTGASITNKSKGSSFRAPKAATAKTLPTATQSQLPIAPSLVKPPSRLCAPNSGRFSVGVQNATTNLQDPACGEAVNSVRPLTSAEVETNLPKQGITSIRPSLLLRSQRASPKFKSNLPGLLVKKALPALGSRKEIGSTKCESLSARFSTKQIPPSAANLHKSASLHSSVKSSSARSIELPTENQENLNFPLSSLEASASLPATTSVQTESGKCLHLETCKCCHVRHSQLLQELEDLKKLLGKV